MRAFLSFAFFLAVVLFSSAETFSYKFKSIPLSTALSTISSEHPNLYLNFIYNELENYKTSATVKTDDASEAIENVVGMNPVSVSYKNGKFYIEALQHGKYCYNGTVVDTEGEAIAGATILLMTPKDSAVITFGITDDNGKFNIPCDARNVIAKFTCIGFKTTYRHSPAFYMGNVEMKNISYSLKDVTVEGTNLYMETDKNIYIPTSRQKNASIDAIDLLRRMTIPQLLIKPGDDSVTDIYGNPVSIYINYLPASGNDLIGMKMTDVKKVEYYENPSNIRFHGNSQVINFIVQEYEYGGYTKFSASETMFNGFSNKNNLFSKFTYKKVTYDFYVGSSNSNYHHIEKETNSKYTLGEDGNKTVVNRAEIPCYSHEKKNSFPVSLRATYNTNGFTTQQQLSFTHNSTPISINDGRLDIDIYPDKNYNYSQTTPNHSNSVDYNSNYWKQIGNSASINLSPSISYTHRNNHSNYSSTLGEPIIYNIREDAYNWNVQLSGINVFEKKHRIELILNANELINKVQYVGTTNFNDSYSLLTASASAEYTYKHKMFEFSCNGGVNFEYNSMNRIISNDFYPYTNIKLYYLINKKNRISGYLYLRSFSPSISFRANDIVKINEFMYYTGNPDLKNNRGLTSNLAYNITPNKYLAMALFCGLNEDYKRMATIYQPYDNGNALIRNFINNGTYHNSYIGGWASLKMLNNKLQFYINLSQNFFKTTGIYQTKLNPLNIQTQASFYWKEFNIMAYYRNPRKKLSENSNIIINNKGWYGISAGWGNGIFVVKLDATNFLNRNWKSATWTSDRPLYSEYQTHFKPSAHANLNLSLTYTIGYGKKIQKKDEIEEGSNGASSAIIQ